MGLLLVKKQSRLPHVRGGVSQPCRVEALKLLSSPRPWGCFHLTHQRLRRRRVFPTSVGVFPPTCGITPTCRRLPHVRGGVSRGLLPRSWMLGSSPRPWGCFRVAADLGKGEQVFPTSVGVFLDARRVPTHSVSLPHVRGGVSRQVLSQQHADRSSPRPWGCFCWRIWRRLERTGLQV